MVFMIISSSSVVDVAAGWASLFIIPSEEAILGISGVVVGGGMFRRLCSVSKKFRES